MNAVELIGRTTKDPDIRYTSSQMCVASFTLAVDRDGRKDENVERYVKKGKLIAVQGSIQTGSYQDRNGSTVYTTEVVASRVEFLDHGEKHSYPAAANKIEEPAGFEAIDEEVPF